MISNQKEIFNKFVDERYDEITKLDKKVNLNDLMYGHKGKTPEKNVDTYDNALDLIDKIKYGRIKLADGKNDQIQFKSNLGKIKRWPKKSQDQKKRAIKYWHPLQRNKQAY